MAPKRVVEKVEAKQTNTAVLLADSFTQACWGLGPAGAQDRG